MENTRQTVWLHHFRGAESLPWKIVDEPPSISGEYVPPEASAEKGDVEQIELVCPLTDYADIAWPRRSIKILLLRSS